MQRKHEFHSVFCVSIVLLETQKYLEANLKAEKIKQNKIFKAT